MKDRQKIQGRKKDKGFELIYYNLSYRRRFIRTLWTIPWGVLALFVMYWGSWPMYIIISVAILLIIVFCIQAYHNYKKWKNDSSYHN